MTAAWFARRALLTLELDLDDIDLDLDLDLLDDADFLLPRGGQ
jgi:hypothetical protein